MIILAVSVEVIEWEEAFKKKTISIFVKRKYAMKRF